jgi:CRISPR/Cas system-associated endonuclease Cas1
MKRRTFRLPRVGSRLKRLVCISDDGYVSLSALSWLSDIDASFILLDRRGKVRFMTGPSASTDSQIRRVQALAASSVVGLEICRTLIDAKLQGQERVIREQFDEPTTADTIARFREKLSSAENVERVRIFEALAAISYFKAISDVEVLWSKLDRRKIPAHWLTVGARQSPLSGGLRSAVTPFHAILNFCAALLESSTRLAVSGLGLLPDLGLGLHTDNPHRDSLVFDVLEPVRPDLESWLLRWITNEPLRRTDFFEMTTGCVRLKSDFCARMSEIAPTLGKLVSPWAEYVQSTLWQSTSSAKSTWQRIPATRLTQQHRREARGQASFPAIEMPKPAHVCRDCGSPIRSNKKLCSNCAKQATRKNFRVGRKSARQPESLAKRSATQRRHKHAIQNWKPSDLPGWLTRDLYVKQVQPALVGIAKSRIRSALGVSEPYSSDIRAGKRIPHARHWQALARLVAIYTKRIE